jgi:hypothetical protein
VPLVGWISIQTGASGTFFIYAAGRGKHFPVVVKDPPKGIKYEHDTVCHRDVRWDDGYDHFGSNATRCCLVSELALVRSDAQQAKTATLDAQSDHCTLIPRLSIKRS